MNFRLLQILRGVAASMVVLHHFYRAFTGNSIHTSLISSNGIGEFGAAGVDIFFVISGFIMFYSQSSKQNSHISITDKIYQFLKNRWKRIFPLYWFWTSVLLIMWFFSLILKSRNLSSEYILYSYLLIPIKSDIGIYHPLLDQGWTLSFEMYFYILFALSMFFKKYRIIFISLFFGVNSFIFLIFDFSDSIKFLVTNSLLIEFIYGAIIAEIVIKSKFLKNKVFYKSLFYFGCLTLILSLFYKIDRSIQFGIPAAIIVYSIVMIDKIDNNKLRSIFFEYLGSASYSIYLTHAFFSMFFGLLIKQGHFQSFNSDLLIILFSIGTILITSQSYRFVEKPLLKIFSK